MPKLKIDPNVTFEQLKAALDNEVDEDLFADGANADWRAGLYTLVNYCSDFKDKLVAYTGYGSSVCVDGDEHENIDNHVGCVQRDDTSVLLFAMHDEFENPLYGIVYVDVDGLPQLYVPKNGNTYNKLLQLTAGKGDVEAMSKLIIEQIYGKEPAEDPLNDPEFKEKFAQRADELQKKHGQRTADVDAMLTEFWAAVDGDGAEDEYELPNIAQCTIAHLDEVLGDNPDEKLAELRATGKLGDDLQRVKGLGAKLTFNGTKQIGTTAFGVIKLTGDDVADVVTLVFIDNHGDVRGYVPTGGNAVNVAAGTAIGAEHLNPNYDGPQLTSADAPPLSGEAMLDDFTTTFGISFHGGRSGDQEKLDAFNTEDEYEQALSVKAYVTTGVKSQHVVTSTDGEYVLSVNRDNLADVKLLATVNPGDVMSAWRRWEDDTVADASVMPNGIDQLLLIDRGDAGSTFVIIDGSPQVVTVDQVDGDAVGQFMVDHELDDRPAYIVLVD